MQEWIPLYSVTGASAATLLGLLFVAVSVTAPTVLGKLHHDSRRMAEQAFQNYLVVVLVSLLAIFPSLKSSELGIATLALTALRGVWAVVRFYWAATRPNEGGSRLQSLRRQALSLIGFGLLIYAALRMAFNLGENRTAFASATVVLLISATTASWQLLLRIAESAQR